MRFYHGTCDVYLPEIRKQGLRPTPEHSFHIADNAMGNLRRIEGKTQFVYLTPHEGVATFFALYRAWYERGKPGQPIPELAKDKTGGEYHPTANPIILTLDVDSAIAEQLQRDRLSHGLVFNGTIPARCIVKVSRIKLRDIASLSPSLATQI